MAQQLLKLPHNRGRESADYCRALGRRKLIVFRYKLEHRFEIPHRYLARVSLYVEASVGPSDTDCVPNAAYCSKLRHRFQRCGLLLTANEIEPPLLPPNPDRIDKTLKARSAAAQVAARRIHHTVALHSATSFRISLALSSVRTNSTICCDLPAGHCAKSAQSRNFSATSS